MEMTAKEEGWLLRRWNHNVLRIIIFFYKLSKPLPGNNHQKNEWNKFWTRDEYQICTLRTISREKSQYFPLFFQGHLIKAIVLINFSKIKSPISNSDIYRLWIADSNAPQLIRASFQLQGGVADFPRECCGVALKI